jgi:hypothetical protein
MDERLSRLIAPNPLGARMRLVWMVLIVTTAALLWRYPEQFWVLVSKLNRIALGAAVAVALDRVVFWYARPDADDPFPHLMYRRAALMCAGMLAAALAL